MSAPAGHHLKSLPSPPPFAERPLEQELKRLPKLSVWRSPLLTELQPSVQRRCADACVCSRDIEIVADAYGRDDGLHRLGRQLAMTPRHRPRLDLTPHRRAVLSRRSASAR